MAWDQETYGIALGFGERNALRKQNDNPKKVLKFGRNPDIDTGGFDLLLVDA